jgi:hypothetical protein
MIKLLIVDYRAFLAPFSKWLKILDQFTPYTSEHIHFSA